MGSIVRRAISKAVDPLIERLDKKELERRYLANFRDAFKDSSI